MVNIDYDYCLFFDQRSIRVYTLGIPTGYITANVTLTSIV